ncbi:uncharacterized protein LOC112690651, partial [Sipha flava]|uniref:Uncharacterized protein LOC112690651 n=1 Tax=Sipha flava TaxID=143950 RepID=A0A8B8GB87_9HEMI
NMDEFIKNWLNYIGFQHLVNKFEEEEINKTVLMILTDIMLKNLIPKIGQTAKFINELEKTKNNTKFNVSYYNVIAEPFQNNAIDTLNTIQQDTNQSDKPQPKKFISDIFENLSTTRAESEVSNVDNPPTIDDHFIKKKTLEQYQDGLLILQHFNSYGSLNSKMRNRLCGVLIKDELFKTKGANKIEKTQFSKIANGIEEFFPSENKYIYFIPYYKEGNKVSPNRRKLYDKYCNLKKKPEIILHQLWAETAHYRNTKLINENAIQKYPALKKATGHILVSLVTQTTKGVLMP